jgi:DNA-binding SARP family transcriptional activator/ABC-type transport system substrate-binding protein
VLEFRILGELEVVEGGRRLDLGGAKQRAVLAILLLRRGEAVSSDRLIDELWGERPPATAAKTLQVYVSHLRKSLGEGAIETRGRAYALALEPGQVDATRFERLAAEGRGALHEGDATGAAERLREALAIWRGPALADFAYEPFAQTESARLEETRLGALEDRIEADLARGEHASLCAELEALAEQHPTRERLQGQLMLALYRSGRQAEALDRYGAARRALQEELGIEPGRELQELQRRMLKQDPALDPPARRTPLGAAAGAASGMRRGAVLVVVGGLILLGGAIGAIVSQGDEPSVELEPNSVAVIDPASGEVEEGVPVGARPGEISAGEGAIWVANLDDESVSQIDPADRAVVGTTVTGGGINGMAAGEGGVWVTDTRRGVVSKVDPRFREVVERIRIAPASLFAEADGPIAAGGGSVWVADGGSSIARLDPAKARLVDRTNVGNSPVGLALGEADLWVADDIDNTVSQIAADGSVTVTRATPVGPGATAVTAGQGAVWVTESLADRVARIDPETGAVTDTIEVGHRPTAIAVGEGGVWVANSVSGTLSRIDPDSREVDLSVELGQSPQGIAIAGGRIWVTLNEGVAGPAPSGDDDGGTMRILLNDDEVDLDTATNLPDPSLVHATCATLYNYPDAPAPAGSTLEPEIAAGPPDVTADGRKYTFTIRPGYAFSPPSDEPVTAASFERAIERALHPEVGSFGAAIIGDIVGAKAYSRDPSRGISGVDAEGDRLVIRLLAPSHDLPARLSRPWFCPVPVDTPAVLTGSSVIPSAGPYYVAEYIPRQRIVLRRNPNYEGSRPGELAEIEYELGVPAEEAIARVEDGDADLYANGLNNLIPPEEVRRLDRFYGAHSEAADAGGQRLFIAPQLTTYFLLLNGSKPPFDDPHVRRAVNFAVDRPAIASVPFPGTTGRPADQILPPGLPGFADQAIYPLGGPDLGRARQLAGPLDVRAVLYVCDLPECLELGETVRDNLEPIGIELEVRGFPVPEMFERIHTAGEPFDLALYNWIADYPDPYDFINVALQEQIGLANPELFDGVIAGTAFERRMDEAAKLTGDERYQTYAELDRDLTKEAAPIVPYASGTTVSLFSERIGCQVQQPIHGIILGRLCVL